MCSSISTSPLSSFLGLYTVDSRVAPAGDPRMPIPKKDACSSLLSISLLLLPPLSSLYILVAPGLPEQVVPDSKSQKGCVYKFALNISASLPSFLLFLYNVDSCVAPAGGPRMPIPKRMRFQVCSQYLCFSSLLSPLSTYC